MNVKVSVLMALYNAEKWLSESIQSVKNQSYTEWELIIVDDGSVDDSYKIAKECSLEDERITVYQQRNQGAWAARNKAFELSKGDFIQYLDADDLLVPDKIEKQITALLLLNDKNTIANCRWEKFYNHPGDKEKKQQSIDKSYTSAVDWLLDSWLSGEHGQTNCWLTPRHLIAKAGRWDKKITYNDDGEFFCRVLLKASQIKFVNEAMVYYRMGNPDSLSQSAIDFARAKSLLDSYISYHNILSNCIDDRMVQTALASNYYRFIYQFQFIYPDLVEEARNLIIKLPSANKRLIFKNSFHPVAQYLGFDLFMFLRQLSNLYYKIKFAKII